MSYAFNLFIDIKLDAHTIWSAVLPKGFVCGHGAAVCAPFGAFKDCLCIPPHTMPCKEISSRPTHPLHARGCASPSVRGVPPHFPNYVLFIRVLTAFYLLLYLHKLTCSHQQSIVRHHTGIKSASTLI